MIHDIAISLYGIVSHSVCTLVINSLQIHYKLAVMQTLACD